jgi:hypothetical protein
MRGGIAALAVLAVLTSAAPAAGDARRHESPRERRFADTLMLRKHRTKVIRRKVAPGLVFTKIIDFRVPRRIFILRADVTDFPITFDVALASPLPARETTGAIAKAHGAIAAINGDFSTRGVGRPVHPFVEDGDFLSTTELRGGSFAVSPNEQRMIVSKPTQTITVREAQTGATWPIDRWNQGPPGIGEIAGFTPRGGTLEEPPRDSCSLRLDPSGPVSFADPTGLTRRYTVDDRACTQARMPVGGGVVLSAVPGTDEATQLLSLAVGTTITVTWDTGFANMLDVQGGAGVIVKGRRVQVPRGCEGGRCYADPRTAIGIHRTGRIIMVVVDGRQPRYSIGLGARAFARLTVQLGAVDALMLDGGGSSTMWVEGKVVNRPSDGQPRHISEAALILPGADPGEA